MQIREMAEWLEARILCGEELLGYEVLYGFASDLMSDVLTVQKDSMALLTGLANLQTIRTAEMSDIHCVILVRGKKGSEEMIALARENGLVLMECPYTMFRASGILYAAGVKPVY
jgi:hypothetical protein